MNYYGTLSGRYIQTPNEITPRDVPMTGAYALFPKSDLTEIYAKAWNANGGIDTIVYKPHIEALSPQVDKIPTQEIKVAENDQIERLISKIDELIGGMLNEHTRIDKNANEQKA